MADRPNADLPDRERAKPEELRDWEVIQSNELDETQRLMIHGGWLYRTISGGNLSTLAMVFVPSSDDE